MWCNVLVIQVLDKSFSNTIVLFTVQEDIQLEDPVEDDGYDQLYAVDSVTNTIPLTNMNARCEDIDTESTEILTRSQNPYYSSDTLNSNENAQGIIDNTFDVNLI